MEENFVGGGGKRRKNVLTSELQSLITFLQCDMWMERENALCIFQAALEIM